MTVPSTSSTADPLRAGELLAGKYRIDGVLGRTAMGVVYLARQLELDRNVAVKLLTDSAAGSPEVHGRFRREGKILAQLSSPYVVRVFDVGTFDERLPYIVMEHLAGEDLAQVLARESSLPIDVACNYAVQAAYGLAAAHAKGIIHRDVKPSNLFLNPDPDGTLRVKVIDFGIAKQGTRAQTSLEASSGDFTQTNMIVGSPRYMSPEQVNGSQSLDARSDVWSLAVILYEAITGTSLFRIDTSWQLFATILTQDAPSILEKAPHTPEGLAAALSLALQRDPAKRTSDILAFASAIARFAGSGFRDPNRTDTHAAMAGASPSDVQTGSLDATSHGLTRCALPAELNAFVGRDDDLRRLSASVYAGARLVTLLGIGGTGKTRLATHFGWLSLDRFGGGVWFCDLSDARTVEGIAFVVAGALEISLGKEDPIVQLGQAIAARGSCLIVLDNFEQVTDHARATLGEWLRRAPDAQFLVTSRALLGLDGEDVFTLDPLLAVEAVELFETRAAAILPGFVIDDGERADAHALVKLLDYLPLAIELAAARVRVMKLGVILSRMSERFKLLATTSGRRARQATLRGAIDWSWDLLSEGERQALSQLSVFEGGFTLEAAEAVLALTEVWPVDAVQALVDKSLVRASKEGRFSLLVSVQEYATERLDTSGAGTSAQLRHAVYYASFGLEAAVASLDTHGGDERRRALGCEAENLATACRRAVARGDTDTAGQTAIALWMVVEMRGPYAPAIRGLEAALDGLPARAHLRGCVGIRLAHAYRLAGRVVEAAPLIQAAISLFESLGAPRERGLALSAQAILQMERGELAEAREAFTAAIDLHRSVGNRATEALDLSMFGAVLSETSGEREARTVLQAALLKSRETGNRRAEALALSNTASLSLVSGDHDAACALFEEAITIYRGLGVRRSLANGLTNLGEALSEAGSLDRAKERLAEACEHYLAIGHERGTGMALGELASVHLKAGDSAEARRCFAEGEVLLRKVDDRFQLALLLANRAGAEAAESPALARADLAAAEAYASAIGAGPDSQIRLRIARARQALVAG